MLELARHVRNVHEVGERLLRTFVGLVRSFGEFAKRGTEVISVQRAFNRITSDGTGALKLLRRETFGLPQHWMNPAMGWERLEETGPGYPQWPDNLISAFRERAYPELRWLMEGALYTGQRGQDCIAMSRNHFDGEGIDVMQQKTGKRVWIPAHRHLKAVIAEIPTGHLLLFANKRGRSWTEDHYRHEVQATVEACGFRGFSLHGLRKNAVTRLLEAGCSEYETASITGQSLQTVRKYAERVNQRVLARNAITKLELAEKD